MRNCWPLHSFPHLIRCGTVVFRKARWRQGYPGVVEQYRADRPFNSSHLFVYDDGTFAIDHVDRFNPDKGYAVEHLFVDHPVGRVAGAVLLTGLVVAGTRAIASRA